MEMCTSALYKQCMELGPSQRGPFYIWTFLVLWFLLGKGHNLHNDRGTTKLVEIWSRYFCDPPQKRVVKFCDPPIVFIVPPCRYKGDIPKTLRTLYFRMIWRVTKDVSSQWKGWITCLSSSEQCWEGPYLLLAKVPDRTGMIGILDCNT